MCITEEPLQTGTPIYSDRARGTRKELKRKNVFDIILKTHVDFEKKA